MPTITRTLRVKTDAGGRYETSQAFNPPGFWDYNVSARATLVAPADTTISGTITITAADHSTENPPKDFRIATGETADLGNWQLDGGDNIIRVTGQTSPERANETIEIAVVGEV